MKKFKILLLSLLPAAGLCAQNPLLVLEAEDAVLTPPVKVKYVNGYSGDAYVGTTTMDPRFCLGMSMSIRRALMSSVPITRACSYVP